MEKPLTLTEADISAIKEKEDCEVRQFIVGDKTGWFRTVNLQIMDAAQAQKKTRDFYKVIAQNCFLAGDPELITRDKYFINLQPQLDALINFLNVEIKNC